MKIITFIIYKSAFYTFIDFFAFSLALNMCKIFMTADEILGFLLFVFFYSTTLTYNAPAILLD